MRFILALVILLCSSAASAKDAPSVFEPKRMDSVGILTSVESCQQSAVNKSALADERAWHFCGCLADAQRVEYRKGGYKRMLRKVKNQKWLEGRQRRCLAHADKQPAKSFGAGAAPSVFAKRELGSASVSTGFLGCDASSKGNGKSSLWTMGMCSCVTDAMRVFYKKAGQAKFLEEMFKRRASATRWVLIADDLSRCEAEASRFERDSK